MPVLPLKLWHFSPSYSQPSSKRFSTSNSLISWKIHIDPQDQTKTPSLFGQFCSEFGGRVFGYWDRPAKFLWKSRNTKQITEIGQTYGSDSDNLKINGLIKILVVNHRTDLFQSRLVTSLLVRPSLTTSRRVWRSTICWPASGLPLWILKINTEWDLQNLHLRESCYLLSKNILKV